MIIMIFGHWTVSLWSAILIIHTSAQNLTIGNVILSDTYFYGQSPPFYPTPQVSGIGGWTQYVDQARSLVSQMTLEEKVMMTGGVAQTNNSCGGFIPPIPRLNFPGMCLADGPAGVRAAELVNGYASGIHAGAR